MRPETSALPVHAIDAVTHPDPYPFYRRLREGPALCFDRALNLWNASRFAVVHEALLASVLRVRPPDEPVPCALVGTPAGEVFAQLVRMNDGAFHSTHRPRVEQWARRFTLDQVAEASLDAMHELLPARDWNRFLTALPVQTMARLLGVPPAERAATTQWVHEFAQGIAAGAEPAVIARAQDAARQLMAQGEREGLDPVLRANRIALMHQSLDATAGLLGNTLCLLLRRPELEASLGSPATARTLVAEVARWDAPVQNTRRFAAEDVVLAGEPIRRGDGVLLVLASANRDESANPRPDEFDANRTERRSLTFGAGVHGCPGEAIAIEIAATSAAALRAEGPLGERFRPTGAYRPLPNVRIPVFVSPV
jgi:cytochrome P450